MAGKGAYLEHLSRIPLFTGMNTRDLQKIARASDEIVVPGGHTLVDQGQAGREAFVIMDGSASVRRNGRKVATLGPGSVVGELSLLDHGPRTATVVADTDLRLLVIDQRHFSAVLEEVPALAHKLLAALAARVRELDRETYG